jgi:hypothetical protein
MMEIAICLERKLPKGLVNYQQAVELAVSLMEEEYIEMFHEDYNPDLVELSLYWNWKRQGWEFIAKYAYEEGGEPEGDLKMALQERMKPSFNSPTMPGDQIPVPPAPPMAGV